MENVFKNDLQLVTLTPKTYSCNYDAFSFFNKNIVKLSSTVRIYFKQFYFNTFMTEFFVQLYDKVVGFIVNIHVKKT